MVTEKRKERCEGWFYGQGQPRTKELERVRRTPPRHHARADHRCGEKERKRPRSLREERKNSAMQWPISSLSQRPKRSSGEGRNKRRHPENTMQVPRRSTALQPLPLPLFCRRQADPERQRRGRGKIAPEELVSE